MVMGQSGGRQTLPASEPREGEGATKEDQTESKAWAGTATDPLCPGGGALWD